MTLTEETGDQPAEEQEALPADEPRRYPSTIGGALYILVLLGAGAGLGVVAFGDDWRLGVRVMGVALAAAGFFRLVLPEKDAGMLAVRRRWVDVLVLAVLAASLILLATTVPEPPPIGA